MILFTVHQQEEAAFQAEESPLVEMGDYLQQRTGANKKDLIQQIYAYCFSYFVASFLPRLCFSSNYCL